MIHPQEKKGITARLTNPSKSRMDYIGGRALVKTQMPGSRALIQAPRMYKPLPVSSLLPSAKQLEGRRKNVEHNILMKKNADLERMDRHAKGIFSNRELRRMKALKMTPEQFVAYWKENNESNNAS